MKRFLCCILFLSSILLHLISATTILCWYTACSKGITWHSIALPFLADSFSTFVDYLSVHPFSQTRYTGTRKIYNLLCCLQQSYSLQICFAITMSIMNIITIPRCAYVATYVCSHYYPFLLWNAFCFIFPLSYDAYRRWTKQNSHLSRNVFQCNPAYHQRMHMCTN